MLRFSYDWLRILGIGMVLWGIGLHLIYAVGLLIKGQMVANLLLLVGLAEFLEWGLSPRAFGVILGSAASIAIVGLLLEKRLTKRGAFTFLMPQYFFMLAAFITDAWIMINGYTSPSTGQPVDRIVVAVALGPIMLASAIHTLSIVGLYVIGRPEIRVFGVEAVGK